LLQHKADTDIIRTPSAVTGSPADVVGVTTDDIKVIILGSGRGVSRLDGSKSYPFSLKENRHGKSVLDWQLSALRYFEIDDVIFVGGHHIEKIIQSYPDMRFFYNPDWERSGTLHALFCAESELNRPTIISYSNVVYRPEVIGRILSSCRGREIAIGVDLSAKPDSGNFISAERVIVENGVVKKLSANVSPDAGAAGVGFFTGICYLGEQGCRRFIEAYHETRRKYKSGRFFEAPSFLNSELTDLLRYLIDNGERVEAIELSGGWAPVQD